MGIQKTIKAIQMQCKASKNDSPIVVNPKFETHEAKINLFRQISDFHAGGKFLINSDHNKQIVNNLFTYCNLNDGEYNILKGLYFHGSVGSGKTTLMKIVSEYMRILYPTSNIKNFRPKRIDEIELGINISHFEGGFRNLNTTSVSLCYNSKDGGLNTIENHSSRKEVCFDELGREPMNVNNFGTSINVMQNILAIRYDNWVNAKTNLEKLNTRTHITTNIKTSFDDGRIDLTELSNLYQPHIADRVREMCNIIHVDDKSFRRL